MNTKMNTSVQGRLSEGEFFFTYAPIEIASDGTYLQDVCPDGYPANHIWTVVEVDGGGMRAIPGRHVVNRVGYVVTRKPWPSEKLEAVLFEGAAARASKVRPEASAGGADGSVPRVVVVMNGGVIQHVATDQPIEILVLDYDVEGCESDQLVTVNDDEAYPIRFGQGDDVKPESVAKVFAQVAAQEAAKVDDEALPALGAGDSDAGEIETMTALVVSTNHVTAAEARAFSDSACEIITIMSSDYGWLISSDTDSIDLTQYSDGLRRVIELARSRGLGWVHFDGAGPKVDGIPSYDW